MAGRFWQGITEMDGKTEILFVDDDPDLLEIGKEFLEREFSCQVTTAESAAEALGLLSSHRIDAIVSDYDMKEMSGIGLLKHLRNSGNPVPFIIFTGKGREEIVVEALNNGADFYLQKGGDVVSQFAELANKIRYAIARKEAERDLVRKNAELSEAYEMIAAREEELRENLDEITRQDRIRRVSEERLLMAQQIGQLGAWEFNPQTGKIWASAEALRIFGFPPVAGEVDIGAIEACIPDRIRVHQALEDLILLETEYNLEYAINPADQSPPRIIRSVARAERDEGDTLVRIIGMIQDITVVRTNAESLRETNAYLENLIRYASVPIIVWDPSFHITRANHAFENLTGYPVSEMIGRSLKIFFPPEEIERSMRLIRTTLDGVRWETVELPVRTRDGTTRIVEWNSSTIYSADGTTPVATIAQGTDITGKKRDEEELRVALLQIKQNIAQLAILNDEIRNPLTVITLHAEQIGDEAISDPIIRQIERIDGIIRQLDRRWIESEKVLGFLRRHHQVDFGHEGGETADGDVSSPPADRSLLVQEVQAELYTILDSIDAVIYVADMETHELLFMNRMGRSLFGDMAGKKCFQVIQKGLDEPCPFCTNALLPDLEGPESVYQWEFQNSVTGRWFDCRDRIITWMNRDRVRLEIATDITGRKMREEQLRESEERIRQITESISILYYIFDRRSGLFAYVSPAYETIWGRPRQSLLQDPYSFLQAVHPDDLGRVREAVRQQQEKEIYLDQEYRIIRPDGTIRWIHSKNYPVRDAEGNIYRIAGFSEDITEQKEIRDSLQIQSHIVENMAEGVMMSGMEDGRIIYANPRFERMLGYEPGELAGAEISRVAGPGVQTPEDVIPGFEEEIRRAGVWSGEISLSCRDGSSLCSFSTITPFTHHLHGPVWISVHEDITERKCAETSLRISEENYRVLADHVQDAIFITRDGRIVYANRRAAELAGYPQDALLSMNVMDLAIPALQDRIREILKTWEEGEKKDTAFETRVKTPGGEDTVFEIILSDLIFQGSPAIMSTIRDITERKMTEEYLRDLSSRYITLARSIPASVFVHREGVILYVNDATTEAFGYSREELEGTGITQHLAPGSQAIVREMMERRRAGEDLPPYEVTILTRDGRERRVMVSGVTIEFGKDPASLALLTDITGEQETPLNGGSPE